MCRVLNVSRQGYDKYKKGLLKEDKHVPLLAEIKAILEEDEFNDKYGRQRLYEALRNRGFDTSVSTVYRVCNKHGILPRTKHPYGLTKQDKNATKSDDLLLGDFNAPEPEKIFVTDITQLPTNDGTLYISALFDCFDTLCTGLSMDDNMRAPLVVKSLENTPVKPGKDKPIIHSDKGSQVRQDVA